MTNFEKFKKDIEPYIYALESWTIKDGVIIVCRDFGSCRKCIFYNEHEFCNKYKYKWLLKEYEEPKVDWSQVEVDAPILVSDDGKNWIKRHFCEYVDGKVYAWINGGTSWSKDTKNGYDKNTWKYAKLPNADN